MCIKTYGTTMVKHWGETKMLGILEVKDDLRRSTLAYLTFLLFSFGSSSKVRLPD